MTRIDLFLAQNGYTDSRQKAKELILHGLVSVNGKTVTKSSLSVDESARIEISSDGFDFVGRGGKKLLGALEAFHLRADGLVCADIGASTGGFTQCLLRFGAAKVFAVDSGRGQLHPSLRNDSRVVSMEETNARTLTAVDLGERCDLCVMDVSFISQKLLYDAVTRILKKNGRFISLIKPQFEAGKEHIGKNGIVRDLAVHRHVISDLITDAATHGLSCRGLIRSPIDGGDGNREYLALFSFDGDTRADFPNISSVVS